MAGDQQQELTDLIQRIPIFEGLSVQECRQVLVLCSQARYPSGKTIYAAGTPGREMLVILKGTVAIQTSNGTTVAELQAVDTVGEMEICTAQPRAARVVAEGEVSGLTIGQQELDSLITHNHDVGVKILKNIIGSLAHKLTAANGQLAELP